MGRFYRNGGARRIPPARVGIGVCCAVRRDAGCPHHGGRPNKKSARRGTEHQNILRREIGDTGSGRWHPVRPDRRFDTQS